MKHPNWKETKEQRRMVRRIATDLAMQEFLSQKKAEAKRKRQFDKLLLDRWKARQAAKNGAPGSSRPTDKVKQSDKVKYDETIQRA